MIAALITLAACSFIAALGFHTYGRTTPSVIFAFMLGVLGMIFAAAAIGVALT